MNTQEIIKAIDAQIAQLQQVRELIAGSATPVVTLAPRRGRPKGSTNKAAATPAPSSVKASKRVMSAEGKARIAAAQKLRWAKQKNATAPAKSATKKSSSATAKKAPAKSKATAKKAAVKTAAEA